jgi:hypothetical protein
MNTERVDDIIKLALSCAHQAEDWKDRELGPIHLVKFLYLADLAYAEQNNGETYTGIDWIFYHYGPWDTAAHSRIEQVVSKYPFTKRSFQSKWDKETFRYGVTSGQHANELFKGYERSLPHTVFGAVKNATRKYGTDTRGLLCDVYVTQPMRQAKPHERLIFEGTPRSTPIPQQEKTPKQLSVREKKRQKSRRDELKARIRKATEERLQREARQTQLEGPYDDVFFEGVAELDRLAGGEVDSLKGTLRFNDDIWHSEMRRLDEIP